MAYTYSKLAETTVGAGGASTITFNNIPQNYTDLVIKISSRSTDAGSATGIVMQFNGSSSSYSYRQIEGSGTGIASYSGSTGRIGATDGAGATASTFGSSETYIPNYTSANYKSLSADSVQENNATVGYSNLNANLWSNTTAISKIDLTLAAGNFVQYSTVYLYGIRVEL